MSSGGMDWAYRQIAMHPLDALGVAVVLHLGWRDHPDYRTDRGIARALVRDRKSVRRATARLERLGVIARHSGQWVACETVAVVTGAGDAPRPSAASADGGGERPPGSIGPRGPQAPAPGVHTPPQEGASGPPKEKENLRKRAREAETSIAIGDLTPFQRTLVRERKPMVYNHQRIDPASRVATALRAALRNERL